MLIVDLSAHMNVRCKKSCHNKNGTWRTIVSPTLKGKMLIMLRWYQAHICVYLVVNIVARGHTTTDKKSER